LTGKSVRPFPEDLKAALARVMDRAVADYGAVTAPNEWPLCSSESELAGAEVVREALATLGYDASLAVAFAVWELHSQNLSAGWIDGPADIQDARLGIEQLCTDIAEGQDYAGFSRM